MGHYQKISRREREYFNRQQALARWRVLVRLADVNLLGDLPAQFEPAKGAPAHVIDAASDRLQAALEAYGGIDCSAPALERMGGAA